MHTALLMRMEKGSSAMKKRKLTYQFHNPNTAEATADMLLKVLIEANAGKVERAIREAAGIEADEAECKEMNPV